MSSSLLAVLPLLLAGAIAAALLRDNKKSAAVAIGTQAIACVLLLYNMIPILGGKTVELHLPWPPPIDDMMFSIDGLGAFFLSWSLPMTLLGTIYATGYLEPYYGRGRGGRHGGPHFALLNMTSVAFVIVYSVNNALVFLLGWEIAAIAAWLLVIWDYRSQRIRFAGFNYLVSTHVGLFVLVAAFMLLHSKTDSMDFAAFGKYLSTPGTPRAAIFVLLGVAFALKSAFFPFHTWLPRAHSAAPAHVSALMSGVIHKAGLFGFLRFTLLQGRPDEWMGWAVLGFGAASAFFGVLHTTTQRDLKRLLGYSSTENVGIIAMGFGVGYLGWSWQSPLLMATGFGSGLLHILNHALFKCLLFYAAGSVYRATHTVDLERLGGLAKLLPRTTMLFLLGGLAMAALPPLNGFVSEVLLYSGLLSRRAPTVQDSVMLITAAAVLAFVGAVAALSLTRAFGITFLGSPRDEHVKVDGEPSRAMLLPMIVHAIGIVAVGLAPELGLTVIASAVELFPGSAPLATAFAPLGPLLWATRALFVALAVVALLAWRLGRSARTSPTWGCGYTAGSPKMQYTGSGFVEHFARIFDTFLPSVRRERLPDEPLPQQAGQFASHHADPVEQRMFEVLGQGEDMVSRAASRIPEQPRFAFAAGLVVIIIIGAVAFGALAR